MTDRSPIDRIIGARAQKPLPRPALWTGLYAGTLLVMVMFGALVAANRLPWLDNRALERNAASYGLFVIFMLIPVVRFLNRPIQMFTSAMIAWVMFVIAYDIAGMLFRNLFQILRTPFQAFIEGAVVYGVFAVGSWVGAMVLHARHHAIAPRRRHDDPAAHHR
ncbi:MAG: hypothetical protein WCD43_13875 [Candidatus Acidiferrales bacterium]